jgi:NitT/TauT family transport system substrate-binding protein
MPANRNRPATHFVFFLIAIAILTGFGCTREPQAPFRVGTHVWPGFEPLYLAREKGYYPSKSVRMVEYPAGSDGIRAFRAGAIDAATLTLDETLLLAETTSDLRVVLVLDVSNGGDAILTQPALSKLRDLKGKRVGLETTALGAYVLTRALQTVGMTPSDVRTVPLESIEQERAFKEGRVDAVVTYEPFRTKILALGARQVFDSRQLPGEIVDVLVVRRSFMAKHREQISQLVRGWFKALDFIRKERTRAASLMAQREGLSTVEFEQSLRGLRFYDVEENRSMLGGPAPALIPTAQRLGRIMLVNRLLERQPELAGFLDDGFLKDASP